MPTPPPAYFVFDIESVADGALVARLQYPGEMLDPAAAIERYRGELMAKNGSDFIPYTFQIPTSVAIAKVAADFRLLDLVVLDEPKFRPHVITENFWRGWDHYRRPTLVSFNGRTFDIPLLELAAFRYGINLPGWFLPRARSGTRADRANRYNTALASRSYGATDEFRFDAIRRRFESRCQFARQAGKNGRARAHGAGSFQRWPAG